MILSTPPFCLHTKEFLMTLQEFQREKKILQHKKPGTTYNIVFANDGVSLCVFIKFLLKIVIQVCVDFFFLLEDLENILVYQ